MKTITYHVMDYYEFSELVANVLGVEAHTLEVVADEEWNNDSDYAYSIDGELDAWEQKDIATNLAAGTYGGYMASTWLNYLCSIGTIQPGNYLITVSW